ncbi:MAG: hypothetical protein ACI9R3_003457 [Verrucomicrobiales bacterium]|jgi:hypothetical protein
MLFRLLGVTISWMTICCALTRPTSAQVVDILPELETDGTSRARANFLLTAKIAASADVADALTLAIAGTELALSGNEAGVLRVACRQPVGERGQIAAWLNAAVLLEETAFGEASAPKNAPNSGARFVASKQQSNTSLRMNGDFTAYARFRSDGGQGTLFSRCAREGKWAPDAKALFIRNGRLVYDIGWRGAVTGEPKVNDGDWHNVVLTVADGVARLIFDGSEIAREDDFNRPDPEDFVFKIGAANHDFGHDYVGDIDNVRFWRRSLDKEEIAQLTAGHAAETNTPLLNWKDDETPKQDSAVSKVVEGFIAHRVEVLSGKQRIEKLTVEPLAAVSHRELISSWDHNALDRGATIYNSLCITCHGNIENEGTLPTAMRFHSGEFKNGKDPFRMFDTISKGFGQMVAQTWMTPQQKYDVIHYIRETFLKEHNESQLSDVDGAYLATVPVGFGTGPEATVLFGDDEDPHYKRMDFGPYLFWTYQVDDDNIAYKALAVRLDPGPGGVSKGRAWMIYDHDTMRVAAAYTGDQFVDWRGIAFDGSHGTHTSIVGEKLFVNPVGPGVAQPTDGSWKDPRMLGRDEKPYGPLPRDWAHYKGLFIDGDKVVLRYTIGTTEVLESPGFTDFGETPIFSRTLNIGKSNEDIHWRLAPTASGLTITTSGNDQASIIETDGHAVLQVPAAATPANITVFLTKAKADQLVGISNATFADLQPHTQGGPAHWPESVTTESTVNFDEDGPFAVDCLTVPDENPWNAHMQMGGFDFHPNNPDKAAICTWLGDVWIVEGISATPPAELKWKRIASGMFQPLGLKYRDGEIFVTCRDQLVRIHDLNGDGETDYIESFNNDHQVTEHFHEFAMGLQTDEEGNFYYAKSARHAKTALVPHHGTLLKVTRDGIKTEILASGFRAANGVCLNPDGSFIVTDQEGHWNPKNRINYVKRGGFYGNMFGYHDVTDSSNEAMQQPLCWITNSFDRSPAELLWVPQDSAWKPLAGNLLNLSYGYGQVYVVPHEIINGQAQGGMCALPIPRNETGIMRGRFSPADGQLYTCGLFSWAGSQQKPGGFYRIRYTDKPVHLPTHITARGKFLTLTFSGPVEKATASNSENFELKTWDLKRTENYGSKHYNERELAIEDIKVTDDGTQVTLTIPALAPTWGMSIRYQLNSASREPFEGEIHNSIHQLEVTQ